jgi:hypothetical protein
MTERLRLDPLVNRRVNFKLRGHERIMDATILSYDAAGYWIRGGALADFLAEAKPPSERNDIQYLEIAKIEWLQAHPDENFSRHSK